MRGFGFFDRALIQRERERWIEPAPAGPGDGRDPELIRGGPSRLVAAWDDRALGDAGTAHAEVVRGLLARGLCTLTGVAELKLRPRPAALLCLPGSAVPVIGSAWEESDGGK